MRPDEDRHEEWWANLGTARTVLGCSDEKYVRDAKSGFEWFLLDEQLHDKHSNHSWNISTPRLDGTRNLWYGHESLTALRLLSLALQLSDITSAVYLAQSHWLDATSKLIMKDASRPISRHQWQVECRNLFNISLARMQTLLIYIANAQRTTPSDETYDMLNNSLVDPCGMIKVNTVGLRNISVIDLAAMLGLALGLWLLTIRTGDTTVLIWLTCGVMKPIIIRFMLCSSRALYTAIIFGLAAHMRIWRSIHAKTTKSVYHFDTKLI